MSDVKRSSAPNKAIERNTDRKPDEGKPFIPPATSAAPEMPKTTASTGPATAKPEPGVKAAPPRDANIGTGEEAVHAAVNRAAQQTRALFPFTEQMVVISTRNVEALIASSYAAVRAAETLTQEAVEIGQRNFRQTTSMLRNLSEARSPTELLSIQSQYTHSLIEDAVEETARIGDTVIKAIGEIVEPIVARHTPTETATPAS